MCPKESAAACLFYWAVLTPYLPPSDDKQSYGRAALPQSELAVFVADFFVAPAWVVGGVMLWQREPLGYVSGTGLLFSASMLFVGVIGIVILQAMQSNASFPLTDVLVLLVMGLICFIPFGLFVRGVVNSN